MPRVASPFKQGGYWVSRAGGTWRRLCPATAKKSEAASILTKVLANQPKPSLASLPGIITVGELCQKFCLWSEAHNAPRTASWYAMWLRQWVARHGHEPAWSLKAFLLEDWKSEMLADGSKPATIIGAVASVQRAWNWAVEQQLLEKTPFKMVKKLTVKGRQRVLSGDEFRTMLRHSAADFRRILLLAKLTGTRPGEVVMITWPMVRFDQKIIRIPADMTKTGKRTGMDRVLHMVPVVVKLMRWLWLRRDEKRSAVFINQAGEDFTYSNLLGRMTLLKERCGFEADEHGEEICLYSLRHTYATCGALRGLSDRVLGSLLGHAPGSSMTRRYIHAAGQQEYQQQLATAAEAATANVM